MDESLMESLKINHVVYYDYDSIDKIIFKSAAINSTFYPGSSLRQCAILLLVSVKVKDTILQLYFPSK